MADNQKQEELERPKESAETQKTSPDHEEKRHKHTKQTEKYDQEKVVEQLKQEIVTLKQEKQVLEDAYKRKVAEFDNYKKRILKEMEDMRFQANKKLLQHILPVYDNLARAMGTIETTSQEVLLKGLSIIYSEFTKVLEDAGVRPIECVEHEFDYSRHEALMMEEREDVPYGMTVIQELERGYLVGDEVLRPSKVKVAKKIVRHPESQQPEKNQEKE